MNAARSQVEQRHARRQHLVTFVWYKRIDVQLDEDAEGLASSCDISNDGIGLVTSRPVQVGALVFLEIVTKLGGLSLVTRVTHCETRTEGSYRVGMLVLVVPPNDRQLLERLVGP